MMFWLVLSGLVGGALYLWRESEHTTRALPAAAPPQPKVGQVPPLQQSTPWTCGPTALRAVLAHYGLQVSEKRLARLVGNRPIHGVPPEGIVRGVRALGLLAYATLFRDVEALVTFLARGIPVMVIVDSFTRPGEAGHWVVVRRIDKDAVTIMDPNAPGEGNERTLSRAEFDSRWWHRRRGEIVRRIGIVVAPDPVLLAIGAEAAAKASAAVPAAPHGRTAKCSGGGGFAGFMRSVSRAVAQKMFTAATTPLGGFGNAQLQSAFAELMGDEGEKRAKEFADKINEASNEQVYAWGVVQALEHLRRVKDKNLKTWAESYAEYGVTPDSFEAAPTVKAAARQALAVWLHNCSNASKQMLGAPRRCVCLHVLQAIALLDYERPAFDLITQRMEKRPYGKEGFKYLKQLLADIEQYRKPDPAPAPPAPPETTVGGWVPVSRQGYTARRRAAVNAAFEVQALRTLADITALHDGITAARQAGDGEAVTALQERERELMAAREADEDAGVAP